MDFMEKNREICKDIRKGVNFFLCLNSSLEKFLTNFLAEASLERSLPENAVANYDVFLVRIADNPFVLFTTHTLVKQSLLASHTSRLLQRSGKRIMWLPEAWLTWVRSHISASQGCHGRYDV